MAKMSVLKEEEMKWGRNRVKERQLKQRKETRARGKTGRKRVEQQRMKKQKFLRAWLPSKGSKRNLERQERQTLETENTKKIQ